jgi:hypothetical protein
MGVDLPPSTLKRIHALYVHVANKTESFSSYAKWHCMFLHKTHLTMSVLAQESSEIAFEVCMISATDLLESNLCAQGTPVQKQVACLAFQRCCG